MASPTPVSPMDGKGSKGADPGKGKGGVSKGCGPSWADWCSMMKGKKGMMKGKDWFSFMTGKGKSKNADQGKGVSDEPMLPPSKIERSDTRDTKLYEPADPRFNFRGNTAINNIYIYIYINIYPNENESIGGTFC